MKGAKAWGPGQLALQHTVRHLLTHPHNLLRITRILKSLSLLSPSSSSSSVGTRHPPSLVLFLLAQHNEGHFDLSPGSYAGGSLERFWVGALNIERKEREWIEGLVKGRRGKGASKGTEETTASWGDKEYLTWARGDQ
jgi:hypothetical protein